MELLLLFFVLTILLAPKNFKACVTRSLYSLTQIVSWSFRFVSSILHWENIPRWVLLFGIFFLLFSYFFNICIFLAELSHTLFGKQRPNLTKAVSFILWKKFFVQNLNSFEHFILVKLCCIIYKNFIILNNKF